MIFSSASKIGEFLSMVEVSTSRLTPHELITNYGIVLKGNFKQDRDQKLVSINPFIGTKWIRFDATSTGEGSKRYDLTQIFYNISFTTEKDQAHPIKVKVKGKGEPTLDRYMEPLNYNRHTVAIFCSCPWFRFGAEWYLAKIKALAQGHKARPYTRKTTDRPPVNTLRIPCCCKHNYQLFMELQKRGFAIRE